jgi:hypothetical protein
MVWADMPLRTANSPIFMGEAFFVTTPHQVRLRARSKSMRKERSGRPDQNSARRSR